MTAALYSKPSFTLTRDADGQKPVLVFTNKSSNGRSVRTFIDLTQANDVQLLETMKRLVGERIVEQIAAQFASLNRGSIVETLQRIAMARTPSLPGQRDPCPLEKGPPKNAIELFQRNALYDPNIWRLITLFSPMETLTLLDEYSCKYEFNLAYQALDENARQSISLELLIFLVQRGYLDKAQDLIQKLYPENLSIALTRATQMGCLSVVDALIRSPRFHEIHRFVLQDAFQDAAERGHLSVVNALISCNRFYEISGVGSALQKAAKKGDFPLVDALIRCEWFCGVDANDLGGAFQDAANGGHLTVVEALIGCARFGDISVYALETALRNAANGGHLPVVEALIGCARFGQISVYALEGALRDAAKEGHLSVVNALIGCNRFEEIHTNALEGALRDAAKEGHLPVIEALIDCNRFSQISTYALAGARRYAAEKGHPSVVKALIDRKRLANHAGDLRGTF